MAKLHLPYYKGHIEYNIPDEQVKAVLVSKAEEYVATLSETEIVRNALENPISSHKLSELAKDKKHVVIISSDHTRPVPSHITMPLLLEEVRKLNKDVKIQYLSGIEDDKIDDWMEAINRLNAQLSLEKKRDYARLIRQILLSFTKKPTCKKKYVQYQKLL